MITTHQIIVASAAHFNVSAQMLTGRRRVSRVATARHVAMYLCRTELNMSYPAIAFYFHCDHTTVMHGVKRVQASPLLMSQAAAVKERVNNPQAPKDPLACGKCKTHERHMRIIVRELAALVDKLGREEEV